jgi:hypothetical protein
VRALPWRITVPYHLKKDLSLCEIDGRLILLDIAQDRYFRLSPRLEMALQLHLKQGNAPPELLELLYAHQILVEDDGQTSHTGAIHLQRPVRSAIEQPAAPLSSSRHTALIETFFLVCITRRQLRNHSLKEILDRAAAYRFSKAKLHIEDSTSVERLTVDAVRQFTHARRYVPIDPNCLLDSLSLLRFLSRRGLPARIVFGVNLQPFGAHCWVQTDDLALNETLTIANANTPIRII